MISLDTKHIWFRGSPSPVTASKNALVTATQFSTCTCSSITTQRTSLIAWRMYVMYVVCMYVCDEPRPCVHVHVWWTLVRLIKDADPIHCTPTSVINCTPYYFVVIMMSKLYNCGVGISDVGPLSEFLHARSFLIATASHEPPLNSWKEHGSRLVNWA